MVTMRNSRGTVKQIEVVAAIIRKEDKIFATQRGLASDKAAGKREHSQTCLSSAEWEQARLEGKAGGSFLAERWNHVKRLGRR